MHPILEVSTLEEVTKAAVEAARERLLVSEARAFATSARDAVCPISKANSSALLFMPRAHKVAADSLSY